MCQFFNSLDIFSRRCTKIQNLNVELLFQIDGVLLLECTSVHSIFAYYFKVTYSVFSFSIGRCFNASRSILTVDTCHLLQGLGSFWPQGGSWWCQFCTCSGITSSCHILGIINEPGEYTLLHMHCRWCTQNKYNTIKKRTRRFLAEEICYYLVMFYFLP